jgi:heme exporter protein B
MIRARNRSAAEASDLVRDIIRNLEKDFRVEFRSRFALSVSISFAVITTIALSLAAGGAPFTPRVQSMLLWLIIFFSAMNGLSHIFVREEDRGTSLFLRISASPDSIFAAKLVYNLAFMIIILCVITPLFLFFMQVAVRDAAYFAGSIACGGLSIGAATTIMAAMVAKAGGKGALFTIISFPLLLPVLWLSISATATSLEFSGHADYSTLVFLLAFSGFITAISFLLFKFVWQD